MGKEENHKVYKLTLLTQFISTITGVLIFALAIILLIAQVIYNLNELRLFDRAVLSFFLIIFPFYGFFLIANSFASKLFFTEHGYIYQTLGFTLTATWAESIIKNESPLFFGKFGILYPYYPKIKFTSSFFRFYYSNKNISIPIKFFGDDHLRMAIYKKAPYLLGFLDSEEDFVKTINALDFLMDKCVKGDITENIFLRLFRVMYYRYFAQGENHVYKYHLLRNKYRDRLSIHAAIWNEEAFSNFEQENIHLRLSKIKQRYQER